MLQGMQEARFKIYRISCALADVGMAFPKITLSLNFRARHTRRFSGLNFRVGVLMCPLEPIFGLQCDSEFMRGATCAMHSHGFAARVFFGVGLFKEPRIPSCVHHCRTRTGRDAHPDHTHPQVLRIRHTCAPNASLQMDVEDDVAGERERRSSNGSSWVFGPHRVMVGACCFCDCAAHVVPTIFFSLAQVALPVPSLRDAATTSVRERPPLLSFSRCYILRYLQLSGVHGAAVGRIPRMRRMW